MSFSMLPTMAAARTAPTQPPPPQHHHLGSDSLAIAPQDFISNGTGLLGFLQRAAAIGTGGITLLTPQAGLDAAPTRLSYADLLAASEQGAALLHQNLSSSSSTSALRRKIVLLHFDNHADNFRWFWAVVAAGLVPAISTPLSADPEQRGQHVAHLRRLLEEPVCLTSERLLKSFPELGEFDVRTVEALQNALSSAAHEGDGLGKKQDSMSPEAEVLDDADIDELAPQEQPPQKPEAEADKPPAVLMLTSGSSGNAKAVALTAAQCAAAIAGKSVAMGTSATSTYLNWIGLDHVANLVEVHLHSMWLGIEQVHVAAGDLLADPLRFVRLIERYRVTHTFAPNFFLQMLEARLAEVGAEDEVGTCDLSCLRVIMSGGEANVVATVNRITARLNALGAKGQVILLGYGLTESCAGCIYGLMDPAYEQRERHEFASIGFPTPATQARVTNDSGAAAEAYELGNLELAGPTMFTHYYNDTENTRAAFTADGWFRTGDRAYIDTAGKINLSGRSKEVLVINGVKYAPQDVELTLAKAAIPGLLATYLAVFAYRPSGGATESYCVVCGVDAAVDDTDALRRIADHVARSASALLGLRPYYVIPKPKVELERSTLGKLSRAKLQRRLESGQFDSVRILTAYPLRSAADGPRQAPQTATETALVETLCDMLHLPAEVVSLDQTLFELGVSSISLFRFEKLLRARLAAQQQNTSHISIIAFLSNPVLRAIAAAIDARESRTYDPVAQIQPQGDKTPLWLVHPASGNALSFLPLARTMLDRPLYALTARGLRKDEPLFGSLDEMADVYTSHVRRAQPQGPYAITGYSLGTTIAYEIARRLEAAGEEVAFCGALDSPPHIIPLVEGLDWWSAAVYITFFFGLLPQERCAALITDLRASGLAPHAVISHLLTLADPTQRQRLNLDPDQLLAIVNVSHNYGSMLQRYEPRGDVRAVDVFYCTPLLHVETDKAAWRKRHLEAWQDFSREKCNLIECDGEHADMLSQEHVVSFAGKLAEVLAARGI